MPRVLICASTLIHIKNFHIPYIRFFKEQGCEVHVAARGNEKPDGADMLHDLGFTKSMLSYRNIGTAFRLCRIIKKYRYDLILTHTALGGAVGRLAVLLAGKGRTRVIHTVHGYLFWNGCSPVKKLLYKLPEFLLRCVTDCVITMNEEDEITAQKLVKRHGAVYRVPGMGVDLSRFYPASRSERLESRRKLSIADETFVAVYAAEFSKRKNQIELVRAMPDIVAGAPDFLLLLCGTGNMRPAVEEEVRKLSLSSYVRFPGWCPNIEEIYRAADMSISSSISEGLPFNIMEAQLSGLPVVASDIRGHTDLITHGETGWLYEPGNSGKLASAVLEVINSPDRGRKQGLAAAEHARRFGLDRAYPENTAIYKRFLEEALGRELTPGARISPN
jgi:glycosyltransferase EpsD